MTINELNTSLTNSLKSYIKKDDHFRTGRLYNSIRFTCTDGTNGLNISFIANDYILNLDDGTFVNEFLSLPSTLDIISEYLVDNLLDNINPTKNSF